MSNRGLGQRTKLIPDPPKHNGWHRIVNTFDNDASRCEPSKEWPREATKASVFVQGGEEQDMASGICAIIATTS